MSRFILVREAGAKAALLIDKLTMRVSEVAASHAADAAEVGTHANFTGIDSAVAIGDLPEISARMFYHQSNPSSVAA